MKKLLNAPLARRAFLGGIASAAGALPFLRAFPVSAGGMVQPKVIFVGAPNGPLVGPSGGAAGGGYDGWRPGGGSGNFALPAALPATFAPLDPFIDDLVMIEGVSGLPMQSSHQQAASLLTGHMRTVNGSADGDYTGSAISLDQHIAQSFESRVLSTAFRISGFSPGEAYWSFLGAEQPVTPHQDPLDAFAQVFGDGLGETDAARLAARRTSILDAVAGDLQSMRARVPAADRQRLDAHLEGVFDLEQELLDTAALQCSEPELVGGGDALDDENLPRVVRDQSDVIVQALACGWARVATLQFGNFGGSVRASWPNDGVDSSYKCHAIAHAFAGIDGAGSDGLSRAEGVGLGLDMETFFNQLHAELLTKLQNTLDVDGSPMLDNTLVVIPRTMGVNHDDRVTLWMTVGGKNLGVQGGRFLTVGDGDDNKRYYNDMHVGICEAMGLPDDSFGDEAFMSEPVSLL